MGAVDATTGATKWRVNLPAGWNGYSTDSVVTVAAKSGTGFTSLAAIGPGAAAQVSAVDLTTGSIKWLRNCSSVSAAPPGSFYDRSVATDDSVAAFTCNSSVWLVDAATGAVNAKLPCPDCSGQPILSQDS